MMVLGILWPTFALVALIFVVWFCMYVQRFAHMKRQPPQPADFADGAAQARYFGPVARPANNLANLFELPVLYFALVPLLILTTQASMAQVALAWCYVVSRATHSLIHIGPNKVAPRFAMYLLSCALLLAMWIGFFVDILAAARAYHAALGL